ncbi:MAG TPA: hypothetical protein VF221_22540, partial [Chloroflexota bacterium]
AKRTLVGESSHRGFAGEVRPIDPSLRALSGHPLGISLTTTGLPVLEERLFAETLALAARVLTATVLVQHRIRSKESADGDSSGGALWSRPSAYLTVSRDDTPGTFSAATGNSVKRVTP